MPTAATHVRLLVAVSTAILGLPRGAAGLAVTHRGSQRKASSWEENSMDLATARAVASIGEQFPAVSYQAAQAPSHPSPHRGQSSDTGASMVYKLASLLEEFAWSGSSAPQVPLDVDESELEALFTDHEVEDRFAVSSNFPGGLTEAQFDKMQTLSGVTWVFGTYHKTGCKLAESIIDLFAGHDGVQKTSALLSGKADEVFSPRPFSNFYFNPDLQVLKGLPHYRLVHFIRDPINIVVSAYRFHSEGIEGWLDVPVENAKSKPTLEMHEMLIAKLVKRMPESHKKALSRFNQAVKQGKTLMEFYQTVPEEEGVIVEFYRSWPEIKLLANNYQASKYDPFTLQLRMETVMTDFESTMECMLGFLAKSRHLRVDQAMRVVRKLDISRSPEAARGGVGHVTMGKYDNSKILEVLESVASLKWAQKILSEKAENEC